MSSESGTTLSRRAAELFLHLLERHDQLVLSRDLLRYRELVEEMVDYGVLAFETHASEIMVNVAEGQESVDVEIDKAAGVACFRCPESGRQLSIPLREIELYRLKPMRLCATIAEQLEIGGEYRRYLETPLLADVFWFIGNADFGGARLPVFFARSLVSQPRRNPQCPAGAVRYRWWSVAVFGNGAEQPRHLSRPPFCGQPG